MVVVALPAGAENKAHRAEGIYRQRDVRRRRFASLYCVFPTYVQVDQRRCVLLCGVLLCRMLLAGGFRR